MMFQSVKNTHIIFTPAVVSDGLLEEETYQVAPRDNHRDYEFIPPVCADGTQCPRIAKPVN